MRYLALFYLLTSTWPSVAADPWQRADGPYSWTFPRDHGAHPAFKSEWWYLTGNLKDTHGHRFGYELTLFRQGVQFTPAQTQSRWAIRDFYFGHFAISDIDGVQFHALERVSRGALNTAHAATDHMDVQLGPWTIRQDPDQTFHIHADSHEMALDLTARPEKPLILEGVQGLSRKGQGVGQASYYYSYPRLTTTGQLRLNHENFSVTGLSWFDHEFSTSSLSTNEAGWDWFCLQLDDHQEIMLYALRDKSGAIDPASEGTWVKPDGSTERLPPGSFTLTRTNAWHSDKSGATYPAGWRVEIPSHQATLTITPLLADQELRLTRMGALDYWEGACSNQGAVAGHPVTGVGYTELTGYAGAIDMNANIDAK